MLLCLAAGSLPGRAAEVPTEPSGPTPTSEVAPAPQSGVEELDSRVSPVDACNRAQGLRPAGATVTAMHYQRLGQADERVFRCRVSWSTARDAQTTRRPILFGPTL
ncbi:MAG: hypothetical protein AB1Z21_01695 [Synechococcaceae cyanobacterium]